MENVFLTRFLSARLSSTHNPDDNLAIHLIDRSTCYC